MIKVFTAFSGYDSQCLALDSIGIEYELVGWSEIDKYAIKAHDALFPQWSDRNYGDISKIDWETVPDFDLFTYSSPCQDFSQAGKQAGGTKGSGTRSSLLWECEKAIRIKRPKYLLMENVSALVSNKFIRLFNQWQLTLESIGYTNFTQVLNAKTHGYPTPVPQNRERVFMVSILDCESIFYFPEQQVLTTRLKDVLENDVDEKYYLKDQSVLNTLKISKDPINPNAVNIMANLRPEDTRKISGVARDQHTVISTDGVCGAFGAKYNMHPFKLLEDCIVAMRGRDPQALSPKRTEYGKQIRKQYESGEIHEQRKNIQQMEPRTDGVSNTITGVQKDNLLIVAGELSGCVWDNRHKSSKKVYSTDGISPTINTCAGGGTETKIVLGWTRDSKGNVVDRHPVDVANSVTVAKRDNTQNYVLENKYRIRKLTPKECFRLMGVREEEIEVLLHAGISNSQLYKLAGNSIVVNCIAAIFKQLFIGNTNKNQQLELF